MTAGALITLALMLAAPAPALASSWSIQPTPILAGPSQSVLNDVSCTSASVCIAVGSYVNRVGTQMPLAEQWNGSTWTLRLPPPLPGGGGLGGVSCTAATSCVAVGNTGAAALAERWNGTGWTILSTPVIAGASRGVLSGVSCAAAGTCIAVGSYVASTGATETLAESWNGSAWSVMTTVNPSGGGTLSRVSCSAANACTALSSSAPTSRGTPLIERWDGVTWSLQTAAVPTGATGTQLYGVTCTNSTLCTAVGHWYSIKCNNGQPTCNCFVPPGCTIKQSTLAEVWGGRNWTVEVTPPGGGILYDVSCAAGDCSAVGRGGGSTTLAELWNGTSWTVESTPTPSGGGSFASVSCTAVSACTAVGQGPGDSLAEGWNGTTWAIQTTIQPAGPANPRFSGVSCPTTTACAGVGSYTGSPGISATLAESWNGTSWAQQRTVVPPGAVGGVLAAVSCPSTTACMATGAYYTYAASPPPGLALADTWNGTSWAPQAALTPTGYNAFLEGVACTAATSCMAAGYEVASTGPQFDSLLTEQWNGSWAIEPAPTRGGASTSAFSSASCVTPTDCIAVGTAGGSTLAEQWNGTGWVILAPSGAGSLASVSCPTAGNCTAVGSSGGAMLAEQWNGATWTLEPLAIPAGATGSALSGVSCPTVGNCVAVGYYTTSSGNNVTLAEQWNGSSWSVQPTPNPSGAVASYLSSVSCASATTCDAVGNFVNSSNATLTLAERLS